MTRQDEALGAPSSRGRGATARALPRVRAERHERVALARRDHESRYDGLGELVEIASALTRPIGTGRGGPGPQLSAVQGVAIAQPMPRSKTPAILVIGGAGFIGSHIVDQLLAEPVREIVVLDNFVRGTRENLAGALDDERVTLVEGSIADRRRCSTRR